MVSTEVTLASQATTIERVSYVPDSVLRIVTTVEFDENDEPITPPTQTFTDFLVKRSVIAAAKCTFLTTMLTSDQFSDTGLEVVTLTDTDHDCMRVVLHMICPDSVLDEETTIGFPLNKIFLLLSTLDFLVIPADHLGLDKWLQAWLEANADYFSTDPGLQLSLIFNLGSDKSFTSFCRKLMMHTTEPVLDLNIPEGILGYDILVKIARRLTGIHQRLRTKYLANIALLSEPSRSHGSYLIGRNRPYAGEEMDIPMESLSPPPPVINPENFVSIEQLHRIYLDTQSRSWRGLQVQLRESANDNNYSLYDLTTVCRDCFIRSFKHGHDLNLPIWKAWSHQPDWSFDCESQHRPCTVIDSWLGTDYWMLRALIQLPGADVMKADFITARNKQFEDCSVGGDCNGQA